jgi:calcineurin-like phosphoesterase family protein
MKLTNEELRILYLEDLTLPDETHGGRAKVRNRGPWEAIQPLYKTEPLKIDVFGDRDIWVWSDIHFGHNNIIKYCNRPYPDVDLMNYSMLGNYLNVVKPNDIVIFGGDVGFMSEAKINEFLDQMPGYKIQIVGNHDLHRSGKLYDLNFDERHLCMAVDVVDHNVEYQLLFTHYPMTNVPAGCHNCHGHIHQHTLGGSRTNLCVEHTNYSPKNLKDLLPGIREQMLAFK